MPQIDYEGTLEIESVEITDGICVTHFSTDPFEQLDLFDEEPSWNHLEEMERREKMRRTRPHRDEWK